MSNPVAEEIITLLSDLNPHLGSTTEEQAEMGKRLFDVLWATTCHQTERAAKFYQGNTPEARLYALMGKVLHHGIKETTV